MNKKEVAELRKLFKPDTTAIDFIVTAFVKHTERGTEITSIDKNRLLAMDDSEVFKYLDIAKRTLSGTLEKNLLNIEFPTSECSEGGCQDRLYKLLSSGFNNDDMLEDFITRIADNYDTAEHLMIQLVHGSYDVPVKAKDKATLEDSDTVYDYMICSICPMILEKAGICYDTQENKFKPLEQKLIADKPVAGFLYPAFNNRATDLYQALFYAKKMEDIHSELITALTGGKTPVPADMQQKLFSDIVSKVTKVMDFDDTRNIHSEIREKIDTRHFNEEDTHITKNDIKAIIGGAIDGVDEDAVDKAYDEVMADYDDGSLALENIVDTTKFNIGVPDIEIKIKPEKAYDIEQKIVDGKKCFVIPMSGSVEVNGVPISDK